MAGAARYPIKHLGRLPARPGTQWSGLGGEPNNSEQRRALALLADSPRGCVETLMVNAHGFTVEALAGLVRGGYARGVPQKVRAAERTIVVVRMQITDAGRQALAGA